MTYITPNSSASLLPEHNVSGLSFLSPSNMYRIIQTCILLVSAISFGRSLFVPEELPTLLSFLYTNIPPVLKGTDSRVGIGFRLGPNADFQVQLELGPQQRTQALGENANKRGTESQSEDMIPAVIPNTPGGWLNTWKTSFKEQMHTNIKTNTDSQSKQSIRLDDDTMKHLQQLYIEQPMEIEQQQTGDSES